ncbi:MAG: hypothetical protein LC730_03580 [Acidobacteria bacterium]|nr:hypothetical protein [Acidobacteriota bacterium]
MLLKNAASKIGKFGILLSFVFTIFLASEVAAQDEVCECPDDAYYTPVRRAPVKTRYVARRAVRAKRVYTAKRAASVYRPAYVAVRHADCDCDEVYTNGSYVVDRVHTNGHNGVAYTNGNGRYYTNGKSVAYTNGNGRYYKNGNGRVYTNGVDADYYDTRRIARDYGYQDGFYDGYQAGMERDAYHPENSGDYQKATNGYEDNFGNKDVYRNAYRASYLTGYRSGFRSVASRSTYRAANRW